MKRNVLILAIVLCGAIQAQTCDTISGRNGIIPKYYYPEGWYDTCTAFYETRHTPENYPDRPEEWGSFRIDNNGCLQTYIPTILSIVRYMTIIWTNLWLSLA